MSRRFASGRNSLVGHGIVYPVPIPLAPSAYRGALVVGLDPADNKAKLYFSDGSEWTRSIFDTTISEQIERLINDIFLNGFDEADLPDPTLAENLRRYAFNNTRELPGFVWNDQWNYLADEARVAEIAQDVLAEIVRFTSDEITIEVGGATPGPLNFPTLGAAIEYLSRFIPSVRTDGVDPDFIPFRQGTIIIRSGWVAEEQVVIDGAISMGWVRIISEDPVVEVNEASLTRSEQFYDTRNSIPFILVRNGATAPRIKTLFECQTDGEDRSTVGLLLRSATYLDDLNRASDDPLPHDHGFVGFDRNARIHSNSGAFFTFKNFGQARTTGLEVAHHSTCQFISGQIIGAGLNGLNADLAGKVHLQTILFDEANPAVPVIIRADNDGLVDSDDDIVVNNGGTIVFTGSNPSAFSGGISQPTLVQTVAGLILDIRTP